MERIVEERVERQKRRQIIFGFILSLLGIGLVFWSDRIVGDLTSIQRSIATIFFLVLGLWVALALAGVKKTRAYYLMIGVMRFRLALRIKRGWLAKDNPMLGLIAGWLNRLVQELDFKDPKRFTIDADYWTYCLRHLDLDDEVVAVADLGALPLSSTAAPQSEKLAERVYLIPWNVFFDDAALAERLKIAVGQAVHNTQVYVGHIPDYLVEERLTPFGGADDLGRFDSCLGWNIFLMRDFIVGAFVHDDSSDRILLHIAQSERLHRIVKTNYEAVKNHSIRITPDTTTDGLKRQWMTRHGIGAWIWGRKRIQERGPSYTNKYDGHIRTWVSDYELFIKACAEQVQSEVVHLIRESGSKGTSDIRILEIGFGTGALTLPLLAWIDQFNEPLDAVAERMFKEQGSAFRVKYVGIDEISDKWIPIIKLRKEYKDLGRRNFSGALRLGSFSNDMSAVVNEGPFDIICASLVLHDLLGDDDSRGNLTLHERFGRLMATARPMLRPKGRLIFADVFTGSAEKPRAWWQDRMERQGLSPEARKSFFENNMDMVATLTEEEANSWALANEADVYFVSPYGEGGLAGMSPFKIMTIKLRQ